ncbi:DUF4019 domain-containing protein [Pseudomonas sp. CGJS7]|uniref:DUF4019 domain-containing protein n=1 Tax=Pseudomonas sp. CGJS7 TaxID=3109348 RepID=UPI00300B17F6
MKMKITIFRPFYVLLAAILASACGLSHAQQAAAPDPNTWLDAAQRAVQMIDQNDAGKLWDGGSAEMKRRVVKKEFIASIKKLRGAEAVSARDWMSIDRTQIAGQSQVPAGRYVNVRFRAALGKREVTELVTFRQEPDGAWRWMGYLIE